ncbi:Uncharacterised protein [Vibrio cholerae]|nr:Uncharacterised protein [Vibrio cholerae]
MQLKARQLPQMGSCAKRHSSKSDTNPSELVRLCLPPIEP